MSVNLPPEKKAEHGKVDIMYLAIAVFPDPPVASVYHKIRLGCGCC